MILVIDNYDSFVHNLARYLREAGAETKVVRNDAVTVREALAMAPAGIVMSPGPHAPRRAGVCLDLIAAMDAAMPLLGVCLGHQCLIEAFGGRTIRAKAPLHGEAGAVSHDGSGVFEGLASPLAAGRYHSLIAELGDNDALVANAWGGDGAVMGVRRLGAPWHGVQFHPESLLTPDGRSMIENFLALTREAV